jgi:hypothetical protein
MAISHLGWRDLGLRMCTGTDSSFGSLPAACRWSHKGVFTASRSFRSQLSIGPYWDSDESRTTK